MHSQQRLGRMCWTQLYKALLLFRDFFEEDDDTQCDSCADRGPRASFLAGWEILLWT